MLMVVICVIMGSMLGILGMFVFLSSISKKVVICSSLGLSFLSYRCRLNVLVMFEC